ncbi:lipoprotein B [Altererythrobacter epoxidivorans]|uniref:Lipoprotein B n=2 Tax=Altererythrobacter epoxidivorans TaxID=361183 RepID=A0A0M4MAI6_9SPHN|nr:lipoprotein B [Altererythrobacter epoxidivorans]
MIRNMMKLLRGLYEWTMDKAAHPHAQGWLAFFCFVEASFFPIPPHPLLGLMCLAEPKKAVRFAAIATLASVAGAMFGYAIGYGLYDTVGEPLLGLLGLSESFPVAACYLREYDVEAILIAGATPVPFKLLTITAGFIEMAFVPFVLASLAARALIFMTVGILFRVFGAPIKRVIDEYLGWVTTAFVVLVVGGFLVLTQLSGSDEQVKDKCEAATSVQASE